MLSYSKKNYSNDIAQRTLRSTDESPQFYAYIAMKSLIATQAQVMPIIHST